MAKNEAKIKFTAETGDFNSEINKANSTLTELRAELKLNKAQMETTGTSVEGLKKEHSLLQAELKASEAKTEALSQKLKIGVKYFGESSTEADKLRTQLANAKTAEEKIKQAINKCNAELDKHENAFDDAGDAAKEAGQDAENSAEGWTIVKDVIADMASNAISWAVESFKELMTASDDALATLGARTGATTGELEKYEGVMKDIYRNNFGESFEDVSDAMGIVIQTFGDLDSASLQNITEKSITLRDTFDYDYQEQMRAVNSLMDKFGITADEAFNLIAQGAQNGLDQNGDLLDTINEYSVQFATAGYSADDMFNMLKNGADSGTWSVDKLGDAVKEFNIRAKDGTIGQALDDYRESLGMSESEVKQLTSDIEAGGTKGQKAYKDIMQSLMECDDETQQYQAGVAIFGTMWEDLGANTIESLMTTKGEITSTKNAMDEMANAKYDTLSSAMSGLGRVIQSDVLQPLADSLAPIAKELVTWLIDNMDVIAPIIAGIATALGVLATALAIHGLIKSVTAAFSLLNTTMLANPITWIVGLIAGLVAAFVVLWNNCDGFRNFWIGLWDGIKSVFGTVCDWIKSAASALWEAMKAAWDGICNAVSNAVKATKEAVTNTWNAIKDFSASLWNSIKTTAANVWNGIKTTVSNAVNAIKTTVSNVWNAIKSATATAFNAVKNAASTAWNAIKNTVTNAVNGVKDKVSNVWNGIKSTTSNVFNGIKSTASNVWNGIKNAITNPIETAKNAVKRVIDSIKSFFKFKISWPNIPMPHFKIKPDGWKIGDLLQGEIPRLSIDWYAEGGIMTRPTIFGVNGNRLMAGGEAGPEAILPIDKLEDYISDAIEKKMGVVNLKALANSIEDLANRPIVMNVNGRQFAIATASDSDGVNGLRSAFKSRGLALD